MPMYFFHVQKPNQELIRDEEGIPLETEDEVREEAIQAARDTIAEAARQGSDGTRNSFVITDDQGSVVMSVPFVEALQEEQVL